MNIKLESIQGTTLVTITRNGQTRTFSSSENRSLVVVDNSKISGVKILPNTEEKILANFLIPVGSVEGFNAITPTELLKEIREKQLFKYGGGLGNGVTSNTSNTILIKGKQYHLVKHLNNVDPVKIGVRQNNDIIYNLQWSPTEIVPIATCIDENLSADNRSSWNFINAIGATNDNPNYEIEDEIQII